MDWPRDLASWPLSEWSRQVACPPHRWHVQEHGDGPLVLFLHGAGGSTHSWAPVMGPLSATCRVVALDLPGHGFTSQAPSRRSGLDAMTEDIAALCAAEDWHPDLIVGHSAGAAIALSLAAGPLSGAKLLLVNPALEDFEGPAGLLFPIIAKTLALNPFVPWLFTLGPDPMARARRLIGSTGSTIPQEQLALYARLFQDRAHVGGALAMMAQWSFSALQTRLATMDVNCHIVLGDRDKAVPPSQGRAAQKVLRGSQLTELEGLGHLAHEEDPMQFVSLIQARLQA